MSYIADIKNQISVANSTNTLLGISETFTGAWEDVTNYTTVAIAILGSLSTATGTLYMDLSTDGGTTFTTVPFIVSDLTFDLPHILNVVESHIRIRYVNDTTAQTGTFSLQTKYSNGQELGLSNKMGDIINAKTEGQIVKSVTTGADPNGNYINIATDGYVDAGSTTTPLGAGAAFDTGCIDINGHQQIITDILSDQDGTLVGTWYNDLACTDLVRTFTRPYLASEGFVYFSAPVFARYFKYVYTNGATPQTDFSLNTKLNVKAISGQILGINDFIPENVVANLGRNVLVGKDPNGVYTNKPTAGVDDNNTTSALLGVSGVFTGAWSEVGAFGEIKVATVSDQDATSCLLQLSHDGVTIHTSLSLPPQLNAATGKYGFIHSLNPSLPYFRVVYTNGAVGQTEFNLTTLLLVDTGTGFVSRATQVLDRFTDVKVVRTVNSPAIDRNRGLLNYQSAGRKFGGNGSVANTAFETVWEGAALGGATLYTFPQAAETVRVKAGGDAADTLAGAGARTITVRGLDENWLEVDEDIDLAGASASAATTTTFIRINKVFTKTVGAYGGANTGNIIIENTSSLNELAYVEAEIGNTYQTIFTVPANKTLYITSIKVSVSSDNSASVRMYHIDKADDISAPFTSAKHLEWEVRDFVGSEVFSFEETFLEFEEKNDIYFEAQRITGAGTAAVDVEYEYTLLDNL